MMYSTFRCKIIVDDIYVDKCFEFLDDNCCHPKLMAWNRNSTIIMAVMTEEERLILRLKIKDISIKDYHIHECDRLAR